MGCYFIAARAILFDLHLFRVLALISSTDVIFFATLTALECNIFSGHVYPPPDLPKNNNINVSVFQALNQNVIEPKKAES